MSRNRSWLSSLVVAPGRTLGRYAALCTLAGGLVVFLATCSDEPLAPRGPGGRAAFVLLPVFPPGASLAGSGLTVDSVAAEVLRGNTLIAARTVYFPPTATTLPLDLIVQLIAPSESLTVRLEMRDGTVPLFSGQVRVLASTSNAGVPQNLTIPLAYVGPGGNVAAIALAPQDTVLRLGDPLGYRLTATDGVGAPVTQFYVGWSLSPAGSPASVTAAGVVRSTGARGTAWVHARLPTSLTGVPLEDSTRVSFAPAPSLLVALSGGGQSGPAGSTLPQPLVARVLATDGLGVPGVPVQFSVTVGSATASAATVITDSLGLAGTGITLGPVTGPVTVEAQIAGFSPVSFALTVAPGLADTLVVVAGNNQSGLVGQSLALPLTVRAIDRTGNPVAAAAVTFAVGQGGGSLTTGSTTTDAQGLATTGLTLGLTPGLNTVIVTLTANGKTVTFTEVAVALPPAALVVVSGDLQADTVGRTLPLPLVVQVTDSLGNPLSGIAVTFAPLAGGTVLAPSGVTDPQGLASTGYQLTPLAGGDSAEARVTGTGLRAVFHFTAVAGAPTIIAIVSGDGQNGSVGQALPQPLVVKVTDALGNAIVGTSVQWQVTQGSGAPSAATTPTIAGGLAQVSYTFGRSAGTELVQATVVSTGASVSFTLGATSGTPAVITIVSGNAQADTVGRTLPLPLVVRVSDLQGVPVSSAVVNWTVVRGGSVSSATVVTDTAGLAQVSYTLGTASGTDTVQAQVGISGPVAIFTAGAVPGAPAQLVRVSGDSQLATPAQALPQPLVARVTDLFGNHVAGITVIWTTQSGGTIGSPTTVSDTAGLVQTGFATGAAAGLQLVRASLIGTPITLDFSVLVSSSIPASISMVSGDGQSGTAGLPLPQPLVVLVQDAFTNPVSGAAVAWTVLAGSGTPSASSTLTDTAGQAAIGYTLGLVAATDTIEAKLVANGATVLFTAVTTTGQVASLVPISPISQSVVVGQVVGIPLVVHALDAGGQPVAGARVVFASAPAGPGGPVGPTLAVVSTDALGIASFAGWRAGTVAGAVEFLVAQAGPAPAAQVLFFALPLPDVAAAMQPAGGNGQKAFVGLPVPVNPSVRVADQYGNAVPGARVSYLAVIPGGTIGISIGTTTTDGFGVSAAPAWQLGSNAGTNTLIAAAGTLPNVTFTATGYVPVISIVTSGDTGVINQLLPRGPSILVLDDLGNPLPGVTVQFISWSGSPRFVGTGYTYSVNTGPAGDAAAPVIAGPYAGQQQVTASIVGVPSAAVVTLSFDAPGWDASAIGRYHTCGAGAGVTYCWGFGGFGQLGTGNFGNSITPLNSATIPPLNFPGGITSSRWAADTVGSGLFPGLEHSCGIDPSGVAYCWGSNADGQLGTGGIGGSSSLPTPVAGGHLFTEIAAGAFHTCAVDTGGQAWCWGSNRYGQLGDGTNNSTGTPVAVSFGQGFNTIRAGGFFSCAADAGGLPTCWGRNNRGQLGDGTTTDHNTPTYFYDGSISDLTLGESHACMVDQFSTTLCWGGNSFGELGIGTFVDSPFPVQVSSGSLVTVRAGVNHTCALDALGAGFCWGEGFLGELGNGGFTNSPKPVAVLMGNYTFTGLSAGVGTCGAATDGQLYCWGFGRDGALGNGSTANQGTPTPVTGYP